MTAASQVFDLPELVRDISDQVYEQETSNRLHSNDRLELQPLLQLLLVNKTFYSCGTDIIWRSPLHSALLNVQPQQRQMYADKIRQISMNQLDDTLMCEHVRFPGLARLSCCVYAGDAPHGLEHYISAYLQESLEHLTIIPQAYSLEDDIGPHGPQVPPNLAGLQLSGPPGMQGFPPFTPVALQLPQGLQLPPGMPNLLPLPNLMGPPGVVGPGMHPDMSDPPIPNSGRQTPPKSFKIDNQLDDQLLDKILNSCPRIQHLELSHKFACGYSTQFSQHLLHLLRGLKHLRSLRMDCKCLTEDVIVFLITHSGLQVLKGLRFRADSVTTAMRRISPAQSFPGLRVLDIHLDQTSISLLLENVTTLQELRLTDISPNAFETIGKLKGLTKLTLTVDKQESATLMDHHFYELQSLSNLRKLLVT
ncbi:hypothetical protein D6C91_05725 [Aureobasidium pullulans]|uniref:F-box/LRR-repeat protein 18 LRR domain-containing protein n=1 Tax=Aureobasidium pullulans TaxID=5580 RepID=A0A4S9T2M8_AURPU|nr:hypothetical protein D6C91_05725 [Aureobasidium pullulans]